MNWIHKKVILLNESKNMFKNKKININFFKDFIDQSPFRF